MFEVLKKFPLFATKKGIIISIIGVVILGFFAFRAFGQSSKQPTFQTEQATKGTLIKSVSASGQITSSNNVSVTIQASGVVSAVYVQNEDAVNQGQKIADITLDQASQQKQAAAWSSYLSAQSSLNAAKAKINSLQSTLFKANQTFLNDKGIANPDSTTKEDPKYIEENADWLQAEADYKNQQGVIAAATASLNSASLTLSQTSSSITAPVSGVVKGLTISPGSIITLSSSTNSLTSTSQVLGSIYQEGPIQAQVNISEIDSVNVSEGQKVTMALDAFPDQTFTGLVTSINTNGVVASGVTTYPAVISFDAGNDHLYPNMGVTAKIITKIKNDVVLVPTAAVSTSNGQSIVRVMKNSHVTPITVEIGDSNDTETEITSGINEGDTVVTGVTNNTSSGTQSTTSPFGNRGFGGFGGGGAVRGGGGRGN